MDFFLELSVEEGKDLEARDRERERKKNCHVSQNSTLYSVRGRLKPSESVCMCVAFVVEKAREL
jgi:hypothetical protein